MSLSIDVFWSFRSPYSYLATPRLAELAARYDLEVSVRPVLPLAVRSPEFFERVNPLWPRYLLRDIRRAAGFLGMDLAWPRPDPVVMEPGTGRYPVEQPHIHRLTRLGVEAAERGRGLPFILEVSHTIWSGKLVDWHQGTHLAEAATRAGCDLAAMERAISADPQARDAAIERNQQALQEAGHWGVPTMVFQGEPFFGQDRIDVLEWRLRQHGLRPRAGAAAAEGA